MYFNERLQALTFLLIYGKVTQWLECLPHEQIVGGSIPLFPTISTTTTTTQSNALKTKTALTGIQAK